ncbi:glycosyltransferase family 2 protein [Brevibacillus invocatus]|uniref:Glucosyl-3-phosphoglycerate synthase n=1 Tax=Brevibacillus invocatus TaxID=173959 RepID=A0A3M8CIQ3_9BACL|nr:glycosyltransferase family 2 protein [Brevibacillus invocatus]MCM3077999.1 glycosyltransferase family 2 protein [Brevibacillus invocatus]MCM3427927.1 glycosyltransferase family 2 protein [Brevibacillus invocatus]RNB75448.1 glycosyltransferase family 2 protein [Brevibacillus invocatus]
MKKVSVVIPAYNEAETIGSTLRAIRERFFCDEVIVVDDGSTDATSDLAKKWADLVIPTPTNRGKGAALQTGWQQASGDVILLLDADLRESAGEAIHLLGPVMEDRCDLAVAVLPKPKAKAGMGLAKGLAYHGIRYLTGFETHAPLSGQRALRRELLHRLRRLDGGFGVEVGMTVDALRAGYRVMEVPVAFHHRETGNDWSGYRHRGKEFVAIGRTLCRKWWEGQAWTRNG